MRLNNLVIIFIIHYALTVLILSASPLASSDIVVGGGGMFDPVLQFFRDYLFFPVRQILNISNIRLSGYWAYVPYILNSILWALFLNYIFILANNFINPKRVS